MSVYIKTSKSISVVEIPRLNLKKLLRHFAHSTAKFTWVKPSEIWFLFLI